MRASKRISSIPCCAKTYICKRSCQTGQRPDYSPCIPCKLHTNHGTTDGAQQGDTVSQIRCPPNATRRSGNDHPVANPRSDRVIRLVGFWTATKHLGQLLPAAAALFVTAPTASLLDFNKGNAAIKGANDATNGDLFRRHGYQRLSGAVSSNGRSFAATASRARKIRERTVPIGHFMISAISS